jgi:hypothetical protein
MPDFDAATAVDETLTTKRFNFGHAKDSAAFHCVEDVSSATKKQASSVNC